MQGSSSTGGDGSTYRCGKASAGHQGGALARSKERQQLGQGIFYGNAVLDAKGVHFAVLDEKIGPTDANYRKPDSHLIESLDNR
jgi:hypothetical protein